MPIYEYQCSKCGTLEVFQRITDSPLKSCPTCKSSVTKLISRSSFHLKGTGWYATDYASKGRNGTRYDGAGDTQSKDTSKSDSSSPSAPVTRSPAARSARPVSVQVPCERATSQSAIRCAAPSCRFRAVPAGVSCDLRLFVAGATTKSNPPSVEAPGARRSRRWPT